MDRVLYIKRATYRVWNWIGQN